ncbi:hypothetical protein ACSIGC_06980 [Tenacibaculum sp. ZS6-P6]|uniref:hypothetical protein n=1 Tax=Tenacibaculum sp. ZS6-P6 TaxID=3447503 RepID=UPI003F976C13
MKLLNKVIYTLIIVTFISCKKEAKLNSDTDFISKLTTLEKFKNHEKRIDSLKKTGMKIDISFSIVQKSFFPEDTLKNISIALVNENFGFASNPLFIVKYDNDIKEIISVKDN